MDHRTGLGEGTSGSLTEEEAAELTEECLAELKSNQQLTHELLTVEPATTLSQVICCEEFGSMRRLIATTARVLEFGWKLLEKVRGDQTVDLGKIRTEAEHMWIMECQRTIGTDKNFKHWCRQLDLFQDEAGLWRCRGIEEYRMPQFPTQQSTPSCYPRTTTSRSSW